MFKLFKKKSVPIYARIDQVHEGTKLRADGGFTCIKPGALLTVQANGSIPSALFVPCKDGRHYLDGQIEGYEYVGLTLA